LFQDSLSGLNYKFFGIVQVGKIFDFCQIHWRYSQIIFPSGFDSQGGINKDPTVKPDGVREPPKYIFKNDVSDGFKNLPNL